MKIIHTSDWHLGARLHDQDRQTEHEAFAQWLLALLRREAPDALVIAGDIFDTGAPSNRSQECYYSLLATICGERLCRMVVVIGGNHDSPSLLEAPAAALEHLRTRVIGAIDAADLERQVVVVNGADGHPGLVIGAVPYLREGDLRRDQAGEDDAERQDGLRDGFRRHYEAVAALARQRAREQAGRDLPLLLTGHLYLGGATLSDSTSERAPRVGNLAAVPPGLLPAAEYGALGHLHSPQDLAGAPAWRYSGSPLPMSFGEAGQAKAVAVVEFATEPGTPAAVRLETVPVFQRLEQVTGSPEAIAERLRELVTAGASVWVELQVTAAEGDLGPFWASLPGLVEASAVRILAHQDCRRYAAAAGARDDDAVVSLDDLTPAEVFRLRLDDDPTVSTDERQWLGALFDEVLKAVEETDPQRERPAP